MNALEIKDLTKSFKGFQLDKLNLTLPQGCIMGLIGENGAGKSTTIKLILQMFRADGGSVQMLGQDALTAGAALREDVGVVPDVVGIPECLTAEQTGKVMSGIFTHWEPETYEGLIRRLNIPKDKRFGDMSRGNKMKLGIAVAMSHGAKLLILDEATSGLDPVVRDEVVEMLGDFTRDENHSVLLSSHIVSDLERLCDYVAFLHKGKLLLCEEKDVLLDEYGILRCTPAEMDALDRSAVLHRKDSAWGSEAVVRRDAVPAGTALSPVSVEELFVHMVKEAQF